jgi:hypothetical protein
MNISDFFAQLAQVMLMIHFGYIVADDLEVQ